DSRSIAVPGVGVVAPRLCAASWGSVRRTPARLCPASWGRAQERIPTVPAQPARPREAALPGYRAPPGSGDRPCNRSDVNKAKEVRHGVLLALGDKRHDRASLEHIETPPSRAVSGRL